METDIYLASSSPRRQELLDQIGVGYRIVEADVPEEIREHETAEMFCLRLALAKARAGCGRLEQDDELPVLGADTVVVVDGHILGKPRDRRHGLEMLSALSANTHHVYTAIAVVNKEGLEATRLSVSNVTFRYIGSDELEAYWETGEPADKAGAYAIQGRGAVFVQHMEGSYSGVMGLPLFETEQVLRQFGVKVFDRRDCQRNLP